MNAVLAATAPHVIPEDYDKPRMPYPIGWQPEAGIYPEWAAYLREAIKVYEIDFDLVRSWLAIECFIHVSPHVINPRPKLIDRMTCYQAVLLLRQIWAWNENRSLYECHTFTNHPGTMPESAQSAVVNDGPANTTPIIESR